MELQDNQENRIPSQLAKLNHRFGKIFKPKILQIGLAIDGGLLLVLLIIENLMAKSI